MTKKSFLPMQSAASDNTKAKIVRRVFLEGTAGVLIGAGIAASGIQSAKAAEKSAKADVSYQESPKDGADCSGCQFFDGENSCEVVEGEISPEGWCAVWTAA